MKLHRRLFPGERREGKQRGAKEGGRFQERGLLSGLSFPVAAGSIHMEEPLPDCFQEKSVWSELGQPQPGAKGWLCIMAGSLGVLAVIARSLSGDGWFVLLASIRKGWYWGGNNNSRRQ